MGELKTQLREDNCADEGRPGAMSRLSVGCQCGGQLHAPPRQVKELYDNFFHVFRDSFLTTHSLEHAQFIVFYILASRPGFTRTFLEDLMKIFTDFSSAVEVRKNAIAYVGSLLVRGKFVSFSLVQSCVEVIVNWCQTYIKNQRTSQTSNYCSVAHHQLFYCACQTVFYVFSFRCREFTNSHKSIDFVRNLNLEHLVFSELNPLAVCTANIVNNFAGITLHYQLVNCHRVIEKNRRNPLTFVATTIMGTSISGTVLDMAFPFDPYMLKTSALYIEPHYQEFEGLPEAINTAMANSNRCMQKDVLDKNAGDSEEEDDFLDQSGSYHAAEPNLLNLVFSPNSRNRTLQDLMEEP